MSISLDGQTTERNQASNFLYLIRTLRLHHDLPVLKVGAFTHSDGTRPPSKASGVPSFYDLFCFPTLRSNMQTMAFQGDLNQRNAASKVAFPQRFCSNRRINLRKVSKFFKPEGHPHHPSPSTSSSSPNRLLSRCSAFTPSAPIVPRRVCNIAILFNSSRKSGEPLFLSTEFRHRRLLGWEAVKTLRPALSTTIEQ